MGGVTGYVTGLGQWRIRARYLFRHLVGLALIAVVRRPQHQLGSEDGSGLGWLAGPFDHLLDIAVNPATVAAAAVCRRHGTTCPHSPAAIPPAALPSLGRLRRQASGQERRFVARPQLWMVRPEVGEGSHAAAARSVAID